MITIPVRLMPDGYDVSIEPGLLPRVGERVRTAAPHAIALLAVDAAIASTHGAAAADSLAGAGFCVARHELVALESRKDLEAVRSMYASMLAAGLERRSPVVALGGGITGDTAGFAAATYQRGVPLIHVPTTLLAMVDAAIGGKTGVNYLLDDPGHGAATVKNMIGAFWQPRAVLVDPLTLRSLSPREFRCGLAECVKHAMVADAALLDFIETGVERVLAQDLDAVVELIARAVRVKAAIVAADEREAGPRALLNLGHTFAHAIEADGGLDLRHGEAVSIGLCAAAEAARSTGRMTTAETQRVRRLLERCGLPTRLPRSVEMARLITLMSHDKKVQDGRQRLILPRGIGGAEIVQAIERSVVEGAWRAVGAEGPAGTMQPAGGGARTGGATAAGARRT